MSAKQKNIRSGFENFFFCYLKKLIINTYQGKINYSNHNRASYLLSEKMLTAKLSQSWTSGLFWYKERCKSGALKNKTMNDLCYHFTIHCSKVCPKFLSRRDLTMNETFPSIFCIASLSYVDWSFVCVLIFSLACFTFSHFVKEFLLRVISLVHSLHCEQIICIIKKHVKKICDNLFRFILVQRKVKMIKQDIKEQNNELCMLALYLFIAEKCVQNWDEIWQWHICIGIS